MMSTPKLPHSTSADRSTKQGKKIADSGLQLERIVRLVARKGSIVEVTGNSTGVFKIYRTHYYHYY